MLQVGEGCTPGGDLKQMTEEQIMETPEFIFLKELFCEEEGLIPEDEVVYILKERDFEGAMEALQEFQDSIDLAKF